MGGGIDKCLGGGGVGCKHAQSANVSVKVERRHPPLTLEASSGGVSSLNGGKGDYPSRGV